MLRGTNIVTLLIPMFPGEFFLRRTNIMIKLITEIRNICQRKNNLTKEQKTAADIVYNEVSRGTSRRNKYTLTYLRGTIIFV